MSSGRYHLSDPNWEGDTEPPPPEAKAYERVSWAAADEDEALALDYLIKAYKRMPTENRVLMLELVKRLDTLP
jgi:hypothetical protein